MTLENFYETVESWGDKASDHTFISVKYQYGNKFPPNVISEYRYKGDMLGMATSERYASPEQCLQGLIDEAIKLKMRGWQIALQRSLSTDV